MRRRPLIYALTADEDQSTQDLIRKYPFIRRFSSLAVDIEIPTIQNDIEDNVKPIENPGYRQSRPLMSVSQSESRNSVSDNSFVD